MSTLWNSRCGLFIGMMAVPPFSSEHRQGADTVAMVDFAVEHRIVELDFETAGRPHAADRRQRAAEHQRGFEQTGFASEFFDQLERVEHRGNGAFLVERAL